MAYLFDFELKPIFGDASVINDEMSHVNTYDYVIYNDNVEKGLVSILENNDDLNSYYVSLKYESDDKEELAELIDDLRTAFRVGKLFGIDIGIDSCLAYFSADYETVRILNLLEFEPNELFYKQ